MKLLFLVRFWPLLGGVGGYFGVKCGQVGHLFTICGPEWPQVAKNEPPRDVFELKSSPNLPPKWLLLSLSLNGTRRAQISALRGPEDKKVTFWK